MQITSSVVVKKTKWNKIKSDLIKADKSGVDVGWWSGFHNNGRSEGITLAQIAQWVDEGHINSGKYPGYTPPRPFLSQALGVALKQNDWLGKKIAVEIPKIFSGQTKWEAFFKELGPDLVRLTQRVMEQFNNPSNSALTISLKGFDNPTIETGQLMESIDWRISERGGK